jgi:hypothetical protein
MVPGNFTAGDLAPPFPRRDAEAQSKTQRKGKRNQNSAQEWSAWLPSQAARGEVGTPSQRRRGSAEYCIEVMAEASITR